MSSDDLEVVVDLRGADIWSLRSKGSGLEVLLQRPLRGRGHLGGSTQEQFLDTYRGGWQSILPNGGTECTWQGTTMPFHGEASQLEWQFEQQSEGSCTLVVDLRRVPLTLTRRITVQGRTCRVDEVVTNRSSVASVDFMWSQHPAFGGPLAAPGTRILTNASSYLEHDDQALTKGRELQVPQLPGALGCLPATASSSLGYLVGFPATPMVAVINERHSIGALMRWKLETYPHAWYWQELNATEGYPWFAEIRTVAVEPATSIPAVGLSGLSDAGVAPSRLEAGTSIDTFLEIELTTAELALAAFHINDEETQ